MAQSFQISKLSARKIVDNGLARGQEDVIVPDTVLFNFDDQWFEEHIDREYRVYILLVDDSRSNGAQDADGQLFEALFQQSSN